MLGETVLQGVLGATLLQLINILLFYYGEIGSPDDYPIDYGPFLLENPTQLFDFIIVGGGTAGCVLANRLTEVRDWKVLVLEAGNYPSPIVEVPAFYDKIKDTEEDWGFLTSKEKRFCQAAIDKKCRLHFGKMLGGTTGMTNLHYERALPRDFIGFDVLTYNKALMHYQNIENLKGCEEAQNFGFDGEIAIKSLNISHPLNKAVYEAAALLDYPDINNTTRKLGYYNAYGFIEDGVRCHFAKAFIKPVKKRCNLYIARNATVSKVLTETPNDMRVRGVEAYIGTTKLQVRARLEVVLTGGAINNAKLLMLSGLGPKDHLYSHNIPLLVNLPVGKNLRDQLGVPMFIGVGSEAMRMVTDFADATYYFLKHRTGAFTHININHLVGAINTRPCPVVAPNIKIYHYFFEVNDVHFKHFLAVKGYKEEVFQSLVKFNANTPVMVMMPVLLHPQSTGEVLLKTTCHLEPPQIRGNYLSDKLDEDFDVLLSGVQFVAGLLSRKPFLDLNATLLNVNIPNCRNYKMSTDQYMKCYTENMGVPMSRPVGTVQYGDVKADCEACTNEEFLLNGIRHLRIVDGSVLPTCTSGSLEATVAMLADKAAEDIRKTWGK